MTIWLDFINTPQVTFFVPFIEEFRKNGNKVLLTCRDSGNTVALLKQNNLTFHIIGANVGKGIVQKLLFFPRRVIMLLNFIRKNKPDIAASQSSFYQPIVARILGIPSLYTNDNEHAKGNIFGFLFATRVILPIALKNHKLTNSNSLKRKVIFYPSVKEAIYLSQNIQLKKIAEGKKSRIYFRPEPWSAQYYKGPLNFFDETLMKLADEFEVIILPRDKNQSHHYTQKKFEKLHVAQKPLTLQNIVSDCLLFIGAGGSMTREMAVLEIPVISIYQAEILAVDQYLVDKGVMKIMPEISYDEIREFLKNTLKQQRDWLVLKEGEESYTLLLKLINSLRNE
jgi:uncharacterized protein